MARGSGSFATFLILCPTSFFLGMLFSSFPYDYPLLWTSVAAPPAYYDQLEQHLRFMHNAPAIIPRILHIVIGLGLLGFITKLYKPSEANMLFDGASLVLYMVGIIVYVTNLVKGLRIVSAGAYGTELVEGETAVGTPVGIDTIGREDSLRVLSASNTILALVLVGVLVLQAGQWYAERKEDQETESMAREAAAEGAAPAGRKTPAQARAGAGGSKKKQ
ncbi:MAG: hypothetical protein M1832_002301 [Thelocarpon impressellum]|nr:MAG: hypothetical protein M1832_002301 [Thelocarpon impressellum]